VTAEPYRGTVTIASDRCKGCELCIAACPPRVLSMSDDVNESGYRYPLLAPGCIGCSLCHAVCPDFVFDVYRFPLPTEKREAQ
jgi:2-oxoglutarate ferredoxin oxidoreductase subunit delta